MAPQKPEPGRIPNTHKFVENKLRQIMINRYAVRITPLPDHWNYDDLSEDGLRLKRLTPRSFLMGQNAVMLWLHEADSNQWKCGRAKNG